MARVRHHRNAGSESIPWATLQDAQVSYLARGLLGHCLSLPPDWDFSAERIAREGKSEFKEGVVAIRRAFKELEAAGYRRLVTERDQLGQFDTYADFAPVPVPEWIEEYHARAARAKQRKKPGPKALSPAAKAAAKEAAAKGRATRTSRATDQEESAFPQVAPEVRLPQFGEESSGQPGETNVSAGGTGSASTAVRSTQLQRSTPTERDTHTQTAPSSADGGEVETGVCVSDSPKNPVVDADRVEAGMVAARRGIAAGARNKLTGSQLRRAQAAVEQAIARGCTLQQITVAVRDEHTDDRTTHPGSAVERALEGLTPAPEGSGVPEEPEGSHRDREADEAVAANLAAMAATEAPEREKVTVVERKPGRDWRTLAAAPEGCKPTEAAKSEPTTPRQRVEENEEAERARQIALLTAEFGLLDNS